MRSQCTVIPEQEPITRLLTRNDVANIRKKVTPISIMAKPEENVIYRIAEFKIQIELSLSASTIKKWIKNSVKDMHVYLGT